MTVGHQSVLHTRDAKHFRRINTPIGPLAHHFFTLLSNPGIDGAKMRQAFAPALSGHRLPPGHELDPTLEPRLRQLLTMVSTDHSADHGSTSTGPPQVCLLQGALRPDHLLEPPTTPPGSASSDAGSVFSHMSTTPSMGSATQVTPDLSEVILVPYMLHQQLIEATQDRDNDRKVIVSMMILATLTHETAHWLYTKVRCLLEYLGPILPSALLKGCQQCHGFKMDPERKATDDPSSLSRHHVRAFSPWPLLNLGLTLTPFRSLTRDLMISSSSSVNVLPMSACWPPMPCLVIISKC